MADDAPEPKRRIPALTGLEAEALAAPPTSEADPGQLEAQSLSRGKSSRDLKKEAEENEHDWAQKFKGHFEAIALVVLWLLFAGFTILALVWFFHLLLPTNGKYPPGPIAIHGWLNKEQLDAVTGVLTSGIIAGLIADHFKRRIG